MTGAKETLTMRDWIDALPGQARIERRAAC